MPTTIEVSATNDDSSRNDASTMPPPEADRAQDADLLAALDDRAGADDAERGDADDQAEAHEALDQAVEGDGRGGRRRRMTCWIDSASIPLPRNADSSRAAAASGSTPGARSK